MKNGFTKIIQNYISLLILKFCNIGAGVAVWCGVCFPTTWFRVQSHYIEPCVKIFYITSGWLKPSDWVRWAKTEILLDSSPTMFFTLYFFNAGNIRRKCLASASCCFEPKFPNIYLDIYGTSTQQAKRFSNSFCLFPVDINTANRICFHWNWNIESLMSCRTTYIEQ